MKEWDLIRKLIVRAPPDLLGAIYGNARLEQEVGCHKVVWRRIVDQARILGIFSAEEGESFLRFVRGHYPVKRTTTDGGGAKWISGGGR